MDVYKDVRKNSGVAGFEIRAKGIVIQFKDGGTYLYTYQSTGRQNIEQMKQLATAGSGLATYINQHVRDEYESRLK